MMKIYLYSATLYLILTPFSHELQRCGAPMGGITLRFDADTATFSKSAVPPEQVLIDNSERLPKQVRKLRRRAAKLRYKRNICIYYDCRGVGKDNGWYRFKEERKKDDGVVRKYIYDGEQNAEIFLAEGINKKDLIPFGSAKHKLYCLACRRIVTAYIEDINILPFNEQELHLYSDFFDFEAEYIQHGVLHASLP